MLLQMIYLLTTGFRHGF